MVIRKGSSDDMFSIRDILLEMHSETTLSVPSIDMEKLTYHILYALKHGYVFVAVLKNKIIGTIGGFTTSDWWSEEKHLADIWFYVSPDNRKSTAGRRLIKEFINVAKDAKMKLKLGHAYSGDIDRKDKFYERLGFTKAGSLFTEA